jgi:tRNA pseudouridine38-40 synthase
VGDLLLVGSGEKNPLWLKDLLEARDRTQGAVTAPAQGLYFVGAEY